MRRPGVLRILRERAIDLWAGGIALTVLRKRHAVMGGEPPIVAIARGKPVEQVEQSAFLPDAPGAADQAVGEGGGGKGHRVARPGLQMREQSGKRGRGIAR